MRCLVCGSDKTETKHLNSEMSVSSDNRLLHLKPYYTLCCECGFISKKLSDEYLNSLDGLYSEYSSYTLTSGSDQKKDFDKIPSTRSSMIINSIKDCLAQDSSMIDIGTGSGVFLREYGKHFPDSRLFAQDITADPNFSGNAEKVFIGGLEKIEDRFDTVSMIHVLEHVAEPSVFLNQIKSLLTENGIAVIQVPDIASNPFDYCIYDHVSHFSAYHLHRLLSKHFKYVFIPEKQVFKELTFLVSNREISSQTRRFETFFSSMDIVNSASEAVSNSSEQLMVFGSSPISTYIGGLIGDRLICFLDEDPEKIGRTHLGKPIIHPEKCSGSARTVIPFPQQQTESILKRFNTIRLFPIKY